MPTLIELPDLQGSILLCKKLGLQFVEINMNLPYCQVKALDRRAIEAGLKDGLHFTFHLDENMDACDFNPKVADAYLQTALSTIDIAKEIDAPILNMHLSKGVYFTLPTEKVYLFDRFREHYLESLHTFRDACEARIGNRDIRICIENTRWKESFLREGIELLLESPVFGLTYDIGHDYSTGGLDKQFIVDRADKLRHMHLHDSTERDCHLILGEGELDIEELLQLAKVHDCRCVIETKSVTGLAQSMAWLKSHNWLTESR